MFSKHLPNYTRTSIVEKRMGLVEEMQNQESIWWLAFEVQLGKGQNIYCIKDVTATLKPFI